MSRPAFSLSSHLWRRISSFGGAGLPKVSVSKPSTSSTVFVISISAFINTISPFVYFLLQRQEKRLTSLVPREDFKLVLGGASNLIGQIWSHWFILNTRGASC